ncbi:MAG: methyltransferase, FxLD system [Pseudonocardia sp.]|nr:methyltransferase, FxLD system [Pseudonocardia sp.]
MRADELRAGMVARLVAGGRIRSPAVERAFRAVPRHLFLPGIPIERAYHDEAIAIKWQDGVAVSSASQPSMMAIMLEQLALRRGHSVLEVGAGTGYNAALMAEIVGSTGRVVAVDLDEDLVAGAAAHLASAGIHGITLATRDGALGYRELAPYDRIVLTVGSWDVQPAWWDQLAVGGRLLLPLSVRGSQLSVALDLLDRPSRCLHSVSVRSCGFVRMRGLGAGPQTRRSLGVGGLSLGTEDDRELDVDALLRFLAQPGVDRPTRARLSAGDLWDGLGLWLAVCEPDVFRLLVSGADEHYGELSLLPAGLDGGTMVLLGEDGLAALVSSDRRDRKRGSRVPVAVRPYGPGGGELADRLVNYLGRWLAAGRPSAAELRLRVYPTGSSAAVSGVRELRKEHSRLILDWPETVP